MPWLALNRYGNPIISHDELLHSEMGLPKDVRAVQADNGGAVFTAWDPNMVAPHFHATQDATPIPTAPSFHATPIPAN